MPSAKQIINKAIADSKIEKLSFPSNLGVHQMIIKFYEYEYSRVSGGSNKYGCQASIALPLPQNISDTAKVEVGGTQLGVMGGITADIAGGAMSGDISSNVKADIGAFKNEDGSFKGAGEMMTAFASNFKDIIGQGLDASVYLLKAGVGSIAPQVGQALSATSGSALNPQTTLVFDGIDLKIHNFEWVFSPKNEQEQKELDKIIQLIQYYIHPDYKSPVQGLSSSTFRSVSRGLLTYPALMQVELVGVSGNLKTVFKTGKYLMVNNVVTDYTPQGMVLNKGGTAAIIRCAMNTTESEIHTRADYRYGEYGALGENIGADAQTDAAAEGTEQNPDSVTLENGGDGQPDPAPLISGIREDGSLNIASFDDGTPVGDSISDDDIYSAIGLGNSVAAGSLFDKTQGTASSTKETAAKESSDAEAQAQADATIANAQ